MVLNEKITVPNIFYNLYLSKSIYYKMKRIIIKLTG